MLVGRGWGGEREREIHRDRDRSTERDCETEKDIHTDGEVVLGSLRVDIPSSA